MNLLNQVHYLPVFLKPVTGRIVLFNPAQQKKWSVNRELLDRLKLKPLKTPYLNNIYFEELNKESTESSSNFSEEENLLSFCLQSVSLPEKMTEGEYYELVNNSYLAVTEKFLSRHVCGHVASSRHILLKNLQIKGVGRTASTHQLSYPNMNGYIYTSEAVRGYYNGQILNASLPFGAVRIHAVLCVIDQKLHSSLVVRDASSHRLAQIEPVFLSEKDKTTLQQEIKFYYPDLSPCQILERVFEQHLCLWALGVEHPMTADNLALSGFPMDEEDMRPTHSMKGLSFDFMITLLDETCPKITNIADLKQQKCSFYSGINHRFKYLIQWYDEAISWILGSSSVIEEFEKRKFIVMRDVLSRFFETEDVENLINIYQEFDKIGCVQGDYVVSFINSLESRDLEISITDQDLQLRYILMRALVKLKTKSDLRGVFNSFSRTPTETIIEKMGWLELIDYTYNGDQAAQASSQLHRIINQQAFSLSSKKEYTKDEFIQYLIQESGGFKIKLIKVFTEKNENQKIQFEDLKETLGHLGEFILIDLIIDYKGKDFALPIHKNPISII
jgi:hypothetical protein